MRILDVPLASVEDYLRRFATSANGAVDLQYEVVDGQPTMNPSPTGPHQRCVRRLMRLLEDAVPDGYEVLPAPWDWVLWQHPTLQLRQPDLVVVTHEQASGPRLMTPPLLAVEVVSPDSVERDSVTKRAEYARAGLAHFWVIDPLTSRLAVFRAEGPALRLAVQAQGDERVELTEPFVVALNLRALTR